MNITIAYWEQMEMYGKDLFRLHICDVLIIVIRMVMFGQQKMGSFLHLMLMIQ